jgi:hypothetical protein
MRATFETATEKLLGEPVQAAAFVKYPGWFQEQAIKKQFRGPLAIPLHKATSLIGKESRDAGQALLAEAGLPDIAVLAVTGAGLRVVRATFSFMTGAVQPEECVLTIAERTYSAHTEEQLLTVLLTLVLADDRQVQYECSRFGSGASSVKAIARIVAGGALCTANPQPSTRTVVGARGGSA